MSVVLGMLARSDQGQEPLLAPALEILTPCFDAVDVLYDNGRVVTDYAAARNVLVRRAEAAGHTWMFMLDSDECMFPDDVHRVISRLAPGVNLVALPRYEFVGDFEHYNRLNYPDYQRRVFRLNRGYRFRRRVHEGLYRWYSPLSETRLNAGVKSDDTPIYHYGGLRDNKAMHLKLYNYERLRRGLRPVKELPSSIDPDAGIFREEAVSKFTGPHPLMGRPLPVWERGA